MTAWTISFLLNTCLTGQGCGYANIYNKEKKHAYSVLSSWAVNVLCSLLKSTNKWMDPSRSCSLACQGSSTSFALIQGYKQVSGPSLTHRKTRVLLQREAFHKKELGASQNKHKCFFSLFFSDHKTAEQSLNLRNRLLSFAYSQ